ncbi:N-acetylglucosamine-6-phosphate deacetylase [Mesobacillus selenatarsenatis]|uniref:N-acetylglucosamine-6-phosphate deacetylase n=1 Tax=Mesobacillus selenatarsenatis (strain DSM 18680 / JCM 14380 / FERM P-15431 / SF-1) TaxID=1321606 RepID=A0A0A8XCD4_MESS1|nr:N-acetylglucosamine-6-phosphate deacetylase [Mesobacillus selenatarsenatis]GAM15816.1 N-acetylglucosamine-6-phosphate deacetylase [Mesobacillus selenatarsenatis SF-1]
MKDLMLINARVLTQEGIIDNGYIYIKDGMIAETGLASSLPQHQADIIELPEECTVVPGFIDVHIHGAGGADTMDGTTEALMTMASILPEEGTTSFLATTITQDQKAIMKALENAGDYIRHHNNPGKAEVLGLHLEGPFINESRKGAQPAKHIITPDIELFARMQKASGNNIRLVTLAPEKENGCELITYLAENGVIASVGHSDATYGQMAEAVKAGATHVTHLFNGMRGLHHRDPGVAGAALLFDQLKIEMIADGIHVVPEMLDLSIRAKGTDGVILITDSMRAKCLKNGSYDLGGQEVSVADGKALLADGTLAGSILKMKDSLKSMMEFTGISIEEAVKLASENPARQLKVFDRKGSIASGKDADLVVLDRNHEVAMSFCRGVASYTR